jgi:hypothetical protein
MDFFMDRFAECPLVERTEPVLRLVEALMARHPDVAN